MTDVNVIADVTGEPAARRHPVRRVLLVLLGVVVLLGALWVGAWVAAGSGVARGTTVLGVPISGQSKAQAVTTLRRRLAARVEMPIAVRAGGRSATVQPGRAGLALDAPATVAAAQARSWDPRDLLRTLRGGGEVTPVVAVDRQRLRAAVDAVAATIDRPPVEGTVRFTAVGAPERVEPSSGRVVRRPDAVDELASVYLVGDYATGGAAVDLPMREAKPSVSAAEVARVEREVAAPAVSGPVSVDVGGTPVSVPATAVAAALTFTPDAGSLRPVLDGVALRAAIAKELAPLESPAVDATFTVKSGTPTVVPGRPGRGVTAEALGAAVLPALASADPAQRNATVELGDTEPAVTTEAATALGVTERVSTFTTYYPSDFPPRLVNIHRAADLMDRTLVLPGKVFSLNDVVGERTAERGFAQGFIINNGQLEVDFGGGVSQLVTTTYNAAYFAGLQVIEHHPHSFYISRYPEGREATVAWGDKDLRFRNDSPHGIFITTSYTNSSVTVNVYGTRRYRIESVRGPRYDVTDFHVVYDPRPAGTTAGDCVATSGVPGFKVVDTRVFYTGATKVKSESFRTTYDPENEVRCDSKPPKPKPKPTSTPTPTTPAPSPSPTQ